MIEYICKTCGTQFPAGEQPPEHCPICEDERQYIGFNGQEWTTLTELRKDHHNVIKRIEPELVGIGTHPEFAIGQRALLIQSPGGNVLWDCISLLDEATEGYLCEIGGISAIAISHPHFYSAMVEWSRAFNAPIYLHADNREFVMRPDDCIQYWDGETRPLWDGITLIRCGGHFPGSTALHWPAGANGHGALLTGDTLSVVPDRRHVSFMYSYPNLIPLPESRIRKIAAAVEPYNFERVYSAWWERVIPTNGKEAVRLSAERYIAALHAER